jgi:quercetin dioxygenase-like cupin family protein
LWLNQEKGERIMGASGPDAVKVAPHVYKVLFENKRVRVLDVRMKSGEKSAMHSHPAYVVYVLDAAKVKLTSSEGESAQIELKPGDVMWREPETHTAENSGTANLHAVFVELKE